MVAKEALSMDDEENHTLIYAICVTLLHFGLKFSVLYSIDQKYMYSVTPPLQCRFSMLNLDLSH